MKRSALALVGMLTAACTNVLSLSPVVTASAAATDDRLLGEWIADDTSDKRMHVSIRRGAARSYVLDFVEGSDSTAAIGHLMPVGQRWLLNLSPTPDAVKAIDQARGEHFDPDVIDAFLAVQDEFRIIAERYGDASAAH